MLLFINRVIEEVLDRVTRESLISFDCIVQSLILSEELRFNKHPIADLDQKLDTLVDWISNSTDIKILKMMGEIESY